MHKFTKEDRAKGGRVAAEKVKAKVLNEWLNHPENIKVIYSSSTTIRNYILEEQNGFCSICSMEQVWNGNPIKFVLDHIDGNSENNARDNLRLVCPNCDSQLDTYKARNTGNGRWSRRQRYKEGKSF